MDAASRDLIQQALWPAGTAAGAWAVLDGARDPRLHLALLESQLEYRSLFAGVQTRELDMASPQLVELLPGHRLTLRLLDEGWGRSWGIFLRIADPANLRLHLRSFLRVQDEDGRRMLFRYYDPRVLRAYLPTCTPDELRQVFGPIECLICEGEGGREVLEFERRNGQLQQRRRPVHATAGA